MKQFIQFVRRLILFAVMGMILGSVVGIGAVYLDVDPQDTSFTLLVILAIAMVTLILGYSFHNNWLKPIKLLNQGRFDEAVAHWEKLGQRYRNNITFRIQTTYNLALIYNLKGEFQRSLELLEGLDQEVNDKNFKAGVDTLMASNLLALEKDLDLAEEYLDSGMKILNIPSMLAVKGYFRLINGDVAAGDQYIHQALNQENPKTFILGFFTSLIVNAQLDQLLKNYSLGVYYLEKKDYSTAEKFLKLAAETQMKGYYPEQARAMLAQIKTVSYQEGVSNE